MGQIYVPVMNVFLARQLDRAGAAVPRVEPAGRCVRPRRQRDDGRDVARLLPGRAHSFWLVRERWPLAVVAAFLVVDLAFFGANLLKFVDGGYIPTVVGAVFVVVMIMWARGRSLLRAHYASRSEPTAGVPRERCRGESTRALRASPS